MKFDELWEITPRELNMYIKRYEKTRIDDENKLIKQAYYISSFVWSQKLPELSKLLISEETLNTTSAPIVPATNNLKDKIDLAKSKGLKVPKYYLKDKEIHLILDSGELYHVN